MIAVQGPERARAALRQLLDARAFAARALAARRMFFGADCATHWFVARTGYTGEDGFEIMLPADAGARTSGRALNAAGVRRCGLGARDTLRLEAGMNLYGNDMDETHHAARVGPRLDRGLRAAGARLHRPRARSRRRRPRGVRAQAGRPAAGGSRACCARTRRSSSPAWARARSPAARSRRRSSARSRWRACPRETGDRVQVDIRGRLLHARASCKPPFVRHGKVADRALNAASGTNPSPTEQTMSNVPADLRLPRSPTNGRASSADGTRRRSASPTTRSRRSATWCSSRCRRPAARSRPARPARWSSRSRPPPTSTARSRGEVVAGNAAARRRSRS